MVSANAFKDCTSSVVPLAVEVVLPFTGGTVLVDEEEEEEADEEEEVSDFCNFNAAVAAFCSFSAFSFSFAFNSSFCSCVNVRGALPPVLFRPVEEEAEEEA